MRRLRLFLLSVILLPVYAAAQEQSEAFTSDLFGGLTGTDVLPQGRLQWETFVLYEHSRIFGVEADTWCPNSSTLRYGIGRHTELSLSAAMLHTTDEGTNFTGVADLTVGFKTALFDGWKAVPAISMRGILYIPGGENHAYLPDNFGFQFDLIFQNRLTTWCNLGYQGTIIWDDTPHPTIFFGAYLDFLLARKLLLTIEQDNYYYGPDEDEKLQVWGSVTLSYQLLPRLELGLCSDFSLQHYRDFANVMVGVAWQLTKK